MKTFNQSDSLTQTRSLAPLSDMRPATLDKIEQAVRKVFAGFDANEVTMAQIAKSANVSLQTLYKYFGDKQTLFYTIMDIVLGRLAARIMDHLQGIDSVQDRLRKTLWVCFDFVDSHPDAVMVLSSVSASRIRNIAIYENKELIGAFLAVLEDGQNRGVLNDTVPLHILFDVFMGFISRLGLMHTIRQTETPLNAEFDALFVILWRAISKPEV
ncbi:MULTISPECIES: TetR/AcrR family transcriptional regulator [Psychrobacter]|uniref:TetR/AcrR family transcriptional regulator n=1 Tax=Psychrobacter TaxID=497 RepID=UPI000C341D0B|nr:MULTISPECIES: TetR/AcrR family transcriptional regulator [Psychrobacter]MBA6244095.1 TetR/AcrR family transcriptional regulator [Psychrobacter sp. Urea-trap-18]MBA6285181.1 TetR/AcrR family transcriptional regulator [Psychrobacter sp. Urea-trap-16]MBA6319248.1 TetR/AcrR family transcriptional regulator [Psychrobacter sp. Urea-trap-20]MBA6333768.1 TetR/AcrR family transcriptional regulator [Psychrobacter sp. Urea-trap-19]PKG60161.1 TetR family transcriptional regulator [Psychrobacter sp. Cho